MGKFGKLMSRLFRRSEKKEKAYVQEEFADFDANQHQCALNPWQLPLVVHRYDVVGDRWVRCTVVVPWCSNQKVYQVSSGGGARNEGSPPPRGVPWATPWPKHKAAERLPMRSTACRILVYSSDLQTIDLKACNLTNLNTTSCRGKTILMGEGFRDAFTSLCSTPGCRRNITEIFKIPNMIK
ncbi:hypothetical protein CDAR_225521 [Caerostris darwini]|uniref:Uncharacterized protein n=1 Tax=Caerostris darwini TaxID=1538125 RepID=A0AAV4R0Q3_9ARAC|nr:hypothetical protein CDAR_225521 [Caerostris darwini]